MTRIKKLKWEGGPTSTELVARGFSRDYHIRRTLGGEWEVGLGPDLVRYPTLEEAQAASQVEYERLVREGTQRLLWEHYEEVTE